MKKRMISPTVIDSDAFLDMPLSTQALYFHLIIRADDDGFVGNYQRIMKMIGSSDDERKVLLAKKFIIQFDNGICVIKHWRIHNYIRKDRYNVTTYLDEKAKLHVKANKAYTLQKPLLENTGMANVTPVVDLEQYSTEKSSIDKNRIEEKVSKDTPTYNLIFPKELNAEEFKTAFGLWIEHKKKRNEDYDELSLQAAFRTILQRLKVNSLDEIIQAIDLAMANRWKNFRLEDLKYSRENETENEDNTSWCKNNLAIEN
jgi:hypothetical protein